MIVRMAREHHETLILVTHDREIARYADRIIQLVDGAVVSDERNIPGAPENGEAADHSEETGEN